jgi:hypothetical protein
VRTASCTEIEVERFASVEEVESDLMCVWGGKPFFKFEEQPESTQKDVA